jgi:hypothetical protein
MNLSSDSFPHQNSQSTRDTAKATPSSASARGWFALDQMVCSLIAQHEPEPELEARLRAEMRLMTLSGCVDPNPSNMAKVCADAVRVFGDLRRALPK